MTFVLLPKDMFVKRPSKDGSAVALTPCVRNLLPIASFARNQSYVCLLKRLIRVPEQPKTSELDKGPGFMT